MLHEQLDYLGFVVLFGEGSWCHSSFVFVVDIYAFAYEEFAHFVAGVLDGVVEWGLSVCVDYVGICTSVDKLNSCVDIAFTYRVEDRSLLICVKVVDVDLVLFKEDINYLSVAFSHSIIKW